MLNVHIRDDKFTYLDLKAVVIFCTIKITQLFMFENIINLFLVTVITQADTKHTSNGKQ